MNTQPSGLSGWRVTHWVAAIGAALLVTLTPLSYIQWKQFNLMQDVAINQIDSIMWQSYQLERELNHLAEHGAERAAGGGIESGDGPIMAHATLGAIYGNAR